MTRSVVEVPVGHMLKEPSDPAPGAGVDPEQVALRSAQQLFWKEFLADLQLDDPEQRIPNPAREGYLVFSLPAPGGTSWLSVLGKAFNWLRERTNTFVTVMRPRVRSAVADYQPGSD